MMIRVRKKKMELSTSATLFSTLLNLNNFIIFRAITSLPSSPFYTLRRHVPVFCVFKGEDFYYKKYCLLKWRETMLELLAWWLHFSCRDKRRYILLECVLIWHYDAMFRHDHDDWDFHRISSCCHSCVKWSWNGIQTKSLIIIWENGLPRWLRREERRIRASGRITLEIFFLRIEHILMHTFYVFMSHPDFIPAWRSEWVTLLAQNLFISIMPPSKVNLDAFYLLSSGEVWMAEAVLRSFFWSTPELLWPQRVGAYRLVMGRECGKVFSHPRKISKRDSRITKNITSFTGTLQKRACLSWKLYPFRCTISTLRWSPFITYTVI